MRGAEPTDAGHDPAVRLVHIDPDEDYRLLVRLALEPAPDITQVGEAADLVTGMEVVRRQRPDVVLVEPRAGAWADLGGVAELQAAAPGAATIVLTSLPVRELGWPHGGTGPRGRLSKHTRPRDLRAEIHRLHRELTAAVAGPLDEVRTRLDADLVSPRRAREFVTNTLARWGCADATATIDLLVSEIVANAVLHANTTAELAVQLLDDRVRVAVTDEDTSQPKRRPDSPLTSTGRGIALIERLSLAWGIERMPHGKRIWFETARSDRAGD